MALRPVLRATQSFWLLGQPPPLDAPAESFCGCAVELAGAELPDEPLMPAPCEPRDELPDDALGSCNELSNDALSCHGLTSEALCCVGVRSWLPCCIRAPFPLSARGWCLAGPPPPANALADSAAANATTIVLSFIQILLSMLLHERTGPLQRRAARRGYVSQQSYRPKSRRMGAWLTP